MFVVTLLFVNVQQLRLLRHPSVLHAIRLAIVESVAEYLYIAPWGYSQPSSLDEYTQNVLTPIYYEPYD